MASRLNPIAHEDVEIEKRKAIPIAIRLAVLQRQIDPYKPYYPDPSLPASKEYRRCLVLASCDDCAGPLNDPEFDHTLPIALGGRTTVDNLTAKCGACHKRKTKIDVRMIAKAARQKRAAEEGRGRKPKGKIKSRGFQTGLSRKMDGTVTQRKKPNGKRIRRNRTGRTPQRGKFKPQ